MIDEWAGWNGLLFSSNSDGSPFPHFFEEILLKQCHLKVPSSVSKLCHATSGIFGSAFFEINGEEEKGESGGKFYGPAR